MDRKTYDVIPSAGGNEEFEQLLKRGRQMHDQAVFNLMAQLVSKAVYIMEETLHIAIKKQDPQKSYQGVYIKQSSRHPA